MDTVLKIGAVIGLCLLTSPALAQTASPNLADQALLASDATYQSRVEESLIATCNSIANEAVTGLTGTMPTALHIKRANQCSFMMAPANLANFKLIVADMVATDSAVIGDATAAGATPLSTGNVQTQATKVTDPHISAAISGQFNTLLSVP